MPLYCYRVLGWVHGWRPRITVTLSLLLTVSGYCYSKHSYVEFYFIYFIMKIVQKYTYKLIQFLSLEWLNM